MRSDRLVFIRFAAQAVQFENIPWPTIWGEDITMEKAMNFTETVHFLAIFFIYSYTVNRDTDTHTHTHTHTNVNDVGKLTYSKYKF